MVRRCMTFVGVCAHVDTHVCASCPHNMRKNMVHIQTWITYKRMYVIQYTHAMIMINIAVWPNLFVYVIARETISNDEDGAYYKSFVLIFSVRASFDDSYNNTGDVMWRRLKCWKKKPPGTIKRTKIITIKTNAPSIWTYFKIH